MEKAMQEAAALGPEGTTHFNFNKLQAVLCIVSSAAVTIGLIAWALMSFA
jgi:hypothetical protein